MIVRALLSALLLTACGDEEPPEAPTLPPPTITETPEVPELPAITPLEGYAYLPGPDGGTQGARFSIFQSGAEVYVGVHDANVRTETDEVLTTLRLGEPVTILSVASEPVEVIDRLNVWYQVRLADGRTGQVFGGLLTPYGGRAYFSGMEDTDRGWGITFAPDGKPRLRVDKSPGISEAYVLDLTPTERFAGGRLEASVEAWGEWESQFSVILCRQDGGEAPGCSSATVQFAPDSARLEQITPPDPWRYQPDPVEAPACSDSGTVLSAVLNKAEPPLVRAFESPGYIRGPETTINCVDVGTISSGPYTGKTVTSCKQNESEKVGYYIVMVGLYLRDDTSWTYLPCASKDFHNSASVQAGLIKETLKVSVDASVSGIEGMLSPNKLSIEGATAALVYHTPKVDEATLTPAFTDPTYGPVFVNELGLVIPHADQTGLIYSWVPELKWGEDRPSEQEYTTQTFGCEGLPQRHINVEVSVKASDLETIATLTDGTEVGKLRDLAHPVNTRMLTKYAGFEEVEDSLQPTNLEMGQTPEALLATNPWLFIRAPWGQHVRLMRRDFTLPVYCEPILYAYADPPTPIHIAPREPLSFEHTIPHGPDGWHGIAQPDGSVIVDGRRWPELFWEGRSVWFDLPEQADVVAEEDIADYLRLALTAQGIEGRELDGFLEAWLPDLLDQGPMRIGFHSQASIEALAPLDITPQPDTLIRVLMDAVPADVAPTWDGTEPHFDAPPPRDGLVVIEWGGMTRYGLLE